MTYRELYEKAERKLEKGEITSGEFDEMTKPLDEEIRPHGEWIWKSYNPDYDCGDIVCSRCSIVIYEGVINERLAYISWNFCPNCGAKMEAGDPE